MTAGFQSLCSKEENDILEFPKHTNTNSEMLWELYAASMDLEFTCRRLGNEYGSPKQTTEKTLELLTELNSRVAKTLNQIEDICEAGLISYEDIDSERMILRKAKEEK